MQNQYINFKRKRELGEVITDTFKFLRRNFKTYFKVLFKIIGIPFILFIAATIYNSYLTLSNGAIFDVTNPLASFNTVGILISTLILYFAIFLFFSFLHAGTSSIIKSYILHEGQIIEKEVLEEVKENIGRTITTGLGKYAILIIGYMLCFFPGVYLSAPLFIIFCIMVFEKKNTSDSISQCFHLIKNEWWMTFLTMIVLGLIWYIFSLIYSLPLSIYLGIKIFTSGLENNLSDPSSIYDLGTITLTVLASALQYLTFIFIPIGATLVYFNLNERKNQTGTLEQIDRLGE